MNRWQTEFDANPLHATLEGVRGFLDSKTETVDAAIEVEKRRLTKVLEVLETAVANMDAELAPIALLNQINGHLRQPSFWNQLQDFNSTPALGQLAIANNHVSTQIPLYYQLRDFSRSKKLATLSKATEKSFDEFTSTIENTSNELQNEIEDLQALVDQAGETQTALSVKMDDLEETASEKLSQWQADFTENQTARAEAFSASEIERQKAFQAWASPFQSKAAKTVDLLSEKLDKQAEEYFGDFSTDILAMLHDATEKRNEIRDLHGLVADESVGGGYLTSANNEKAQASFWRFTSIFFMVLTAIWVGFTIFSNFGYSTEGVFSWIMMIKAASLATILISIAAYAARQSSLHRNNETQTRRFALEVTAISPFIASLEPDQQAHLKTALVERLFGRQIGGESEGGVGPSAEMVKLLAELAKKIPSK